MLYTYSAKAVVMVIGGAPVSGLGPDEFFTCEVNDDDWAEVEGADGIVVRSLMPNTVANGTITLQQSSPFNQVLTSMRNRDTGRANGFSVGSGVTNFYIKDPLSGEKLTAAVMYVKKETTTSYAKNSGNREWAITLIDPIFSVNEANLIIQQGINGVFGAIDLASAASA